MKKFLLGSALLLTLSFSLNSCGEKLLTEEERSKRIEELTAAKTTELTPMLDELCNTNMAQYVQTAVDSIVASRMPAEEM